MASRKSTFTNLAIGALGGTAFISFATILTLPSGSDAPASFEAWLVFGLMLLASIALPTSSNHFVPIVYITYGSLFCAPLLAQLLLGMAQWQRYYFWASALTSLLLIWIFRFGDRRAHATPNRVATPGRPPMLFMLASSAFSIAVSVATSGGEGEDGKFAFTFSFALLLIAYEGVCRNARPIRFYIGTVLVYLPVIVFLLFVWSGFGRLEVGAFILAPIIIAHTLGRSSFHQTIAFILTPAAIFISTAIRYAKERGYLDGYLEFFLDSLSSGSVVDHINWTHFMFYWSYNNRAPSLWPFLDQYSLLFLQFIPRAWWSGKPIGIAYSAVDDIFNREGVPAGHSISLGCVGELVYLAGDLWVFAAIMVFLTIAFLREVIRRLSAGRVSALVFFDVSLLTYVWGGMASFGSRVWFVCIPIVAYFMLLKYFKARSPKSPRTRQAAELRSAV